MSTPTPPQGNQQDQKIDLRNVKDHVGDIAGFDQRASLTIAQWVLIIFGGVYLLDFAGMFILFFQTDATFEKGADLVKFMVQSLLPLVTLAVGYYLGDKNRHHTPAARKR